MKYIKLDLSHDNFYCPATGVHIQGNNHFEPEASSLKGYWVSLVGLNDPEFNDTDLKTAWEIFMGDDEDKSVDWDDLEKFLQDCDKPNHVAFEISTGCGPASSTVVFVIDMDTGK